jgi:hypothetical protein
MQLCALISMKNVLNNYSSQRLILQIVLLVILLYST